MRPMANLPSLDAERGTAGSSGRGPAQINKPTVAHSATAAGVELREAPRADFGTVVSAYETPLLRYLTRMAPPHEAEDIAQEAFLRLHRELSMRPVTNVAGFLFRAAHNLALDQRRRRRAREAMKTRAARELAPEIKEDSPEGLAALIRRAACEKALEELAKLPAKQRRALLLKVIQDFTVREIAEITGTTVGNAGYHLNAGLRELARRLKAAGVI